LPLTAWIELLRFIRARSGDPALGRRLVRTLDLRKQGFWGYALLSSASVAERLEIHRRYQALRSPVQFTTTVDRDALVVDVETPGIPDDLIPVTLDFGCAGACLHLRTHLGRVRSPMELRFSYGEQVHHRAIRELVDGHVVFDAPFNRLRMPVSALGQTLRGDQHLRKLAGEQLDTWLRPARQSVLGDCAPPPRCYPQKRPLPDRRACQPCIANADCGAPHATCAKQQPYVGAATNEMVDVPGGYCTQRCALDKECGEGAQCINHGTLGGLCLASCTGDATRRAGYACFAHGRNGDTVGAGCAAPSP